MHALDFPAKSFDLVLLMHALTYAEKPAVGDRRSRACAAHGRPAARRHAGPARAPFRGRAVRSPQSRLQTARNCASWRAPRSSTSIVCERLTRERRPPHFEVIESPGEEAMSMPSPWLESRTRAEAARCARRAHPRHRRRDGHDGAELSPGRSTTIAANVSPTASIASTNPRATRSRIPAAISRATTICSR